MSYILITVAILVLVIFAMIVRTVNLLEVFSGSFYKRAGTSNKVNALLFPITFILGTIAIVWSYSSASKEFLPAPSSVHGKEVDFIFWLDMGIIVFVFVATHILLFFFPYMYQFKEGRKAYYYPDNNKLEVIWTTIPAIVLAVLVFTGWRVWTDITGEAPKSAYNIEIVGKQFNWMVRYPGTDGIIGKHNFRKIDALNEVGIDFDDKAALDDFMANEIHLPVGKPVELKIRARDVLHSVFMPHFRVKMDAVPGMPTRFWFIPDKTTADMRTELRNPNFNYELACTEICGRNHFGMRKVIVVESEEEYLEWLKSQEVFLAKNPDYIKNVPEKLRADAERIISKKPAEGVPAQAAL